MPAMIDATHRMLSDTAPPRRGDGRGGRRHVRRRRQDAHRLPDPRFGDRRVNLPLPYSYSNDSHRLLAVGASGRSYDANGNTTRRDLTSRSDATLGYDERNRLVSVASSGGTTRYRHNARGERVYKQVFGKTRRYAYDAAGRILVEDASAAGGQVQEFLWLDDLPVGLLNGTNLYPIQPDHLGSPRKVTNQKLTAPILFWHWPILDNPFGEAQANQDPDGDRKAFPFHLRFPGQQYDPETGLHYNYFRDYEPGVGRYVESDPVGLGAGTSTFSYVNGDPVTNIDVFGLRPRCMPGFGFNGLRQCERRLPEPDPNCKSGNTNTCQLECDGIAVRCARSATNISHAAAFGSVLLIFAPEPTTITKWCAVALVAVSAAQMERAQRCQENGLKCKDWDTHKA
ncbi:MAG: RHS repeat domain-containing protein [Lysobacterales bacterium]